MKEERQGRIIEIIENHDIETQEELANALRKAGYDVTQATVSRDIRELKLTKVQLGHGHQKYALMENSYGQIGGLSVKYVRVLKEGFMSVTQAQNILVIKTVAGMAMAVGAALDAMEMPGIAGCIAGDDTIFAAARSAGDAVDVMRRILELTKK
ncbi:MAG: arginine repressor [Lachnospiraceae bacterium]|jgi:transcriptional regulator of arginine metabolism|nr:arginine repressor [Lachnospiraceae bacterium]